MDHAIGALTPVNFVEVSHDAVVQLMNDRPRVARALWWQFLVGVAVQREWTVNVGLRSALERLGHLFCELYLRLEAVGLANGYGYDFPITQTDLADATALTPVHVNRMLKELRASGLISLGGRVLTIPDFDVLQDTALFTPDYLHLGQKGNSSDLRIVSPGGVR